MRGRRTDAPAEQTHRSPVGRPVAEYGFHPASLAAQAKAQRRRKCDLADAVYRPRGPWGRAPRAEMAFTFHRNDPEATRASLAATVERAMDEGRLADATALLRTWMTTQAYFEARRSLLGR